MHWWETLVAGLAATIAMTALMRMGAATGMTRMNMIVMLGSMFRRDEQGARKLGAAVHLVNGLVFALVYGAAWAALDPEPSDAWWIGLVFGAIHAIAAIVMMPLLSSMHPRVRPAHATDPGSRDEVVLPPFGVGGTGFGSMTPAGILIGHLVFGLVWGLVFSALV